MICKGSNPRYIDVSQKYNRENKAIQYVLQVWEN